MTTPHPLLPALAMAGLLFAGAAMAQNASPSTMDNGTATHSATYQTPQGTLVVNSVPAPAPMIAPAPEFKQLSAGSKWITAEQASSYPPLANDFLNADRNKDGKISMSEYAQWTKQP